MSRPKERTRDRDRRRRRNSDHTRQCRIAPCKRGPVEHGREPEREVGVCAECEGVGDSECGGEVRQDGVWVVIGRRGARKRHQRNEGGIELVQMVDIRKLLREKACWVAMKASRAARLYSRSHGRKKAGEMAVEDERQRY